MFWNLVRYEFKNVNKWYLALYGAVLFLSVLIGIQTQSLIKLPEKIYLFYFFFLSTVFGGLMVTLVISTIFLIIKRFKGSVYDRQGYLTLTLPVSEHHIITAKLIGAFIWSLISTAVLLLCIYIILLSTNSDAVQLSTLLSFVAEHFTGFSLAVLSFLLKYHFLGISASTWPFPLDNCSMNTVQHSLLQPTLVSKSSLEL